jgi:hypothetical protein
MSLFEKATRSKYRFNFKGVISVEDLWDLPVQDLNTIFKGLSKAKKETVEESLIPTEAPSREQKELANKIEILRHVVTVKLKEQEEQQLAAANRVKRQRILELMQRKQEADLEGKTMDELQGLLESM